MSSERRPIEEHLHIKNWPVGDRPREMLLEKGAGALSDAALLAILLRTGRHGQNAIALAKETINKFGGLHGLMTATQEDLLEIKGIGKAKVAHILAAMEIVKRQRLRRFPQNAVNDNFGCDFVIRQEKRSYHIEVKATEGEEEFFELGLSEIRHTVEVANKRNVKFLILHITKALSSEPDFRFLPNPYDRKYQRSYHIQTERKCYDDIATIFCRAIHNPHCHQLVSGRFE